jgi:hypothetical protein
LHGVEVAQILEGLTVLAGAPLEKFVPNTPSRLRSARTCYDHLAGTLGVALKDRLSAMEWLSGEPAGDGKAYDLTPAGARALTKFGVDIAETRMLRRRFAYSCLDWSERRPHIGGALGAALLTLFLNRKWLVQDLDSRALEVTSLGRRQMRSQFGIDV